MKSQAVIGCGFGDEGKGKVVSYLCSQSSNPLVIRFCGGQQAGHHVILESGLDHVFSNFGSGTLQGFDTYWSKFCTIDPVGIINELLDLKIKGINPTLYIDARCPVTTPYEKWYNRLYDRKTGHGSCGVGVGQTLQREEDYYSILFSDLYCKSVLKIKTFLLEKYYGFAIDSIDDFISICEDLVDCYNIRITHGFPQKAYDNYIFEGSQGLLLDKNIGFFPHVTRANTDTTNILSMGFNPEVFLVTRGYQTRHGNGPMTNEKIKHSIKNNPYEQNYDGTFQGKFRTSVLDLDLLKYAVGRSGIKEPSLCITCLDLVKDNYSFTENEAFNNSYNVEDFAKRIGSSLGANEIYLSRTPFPDTATLI